MKTIAVALIAVAAAFTWLINPLNAQSTRSESTQAVQSPSTGPHGGSLRHADAIQVETVITRGGIRVFLYDSVGHPVNVEAGRGSASLQLNGSAKRYRYDLLPDGKDALATAVNLEKIAGRQVKLDVQLIGVPVPSKRVAYHEIATVPHDNAHREIVDANVNSEARTIEQIVITVTTATAEDAKLVTRQAKCPVMDEPLGSMGSPIKVMVGDKPIFLCCKGCIKKIQAEPRKYLAIVYGDAAVIEMESHNTASHLVAPPAGEQVREGVFKVTDADAPFIAQQKRCPVMDEPLDAMGGPFKVNAQGRAIYICCPGCAKSIAKEPQKYLDQLAKQGVDAPLLR